MKFKKRLVMKVDLNADRDFSDAKSSSNVVFKMSNSILTKLVVNSAYIGDDDTGVIIFRTLSGKAFKRMLDNNSIELTSKKYKIIDYKEMVKAI